MGLKYNPYWAFYGIKMYERDELFLYTSKTTDDLLHLILSENAGVAFKSLCALAYRELDSNVIDALKEVNDNGKTFKNRKLAFNIISQLFPEHSEGLKPGDSKQIGYVYFIQDRLSGIVKIGRTKNMERRLAIFTRKLSFPIQLIQYIKTINYEIIELAFHRHYDNKRLRGEWFKLDQDEIEQIKQKVFPEEIALLIIENT